MDKDNAVIYKSCGVWYYTPESNYNARIQDAHKIHQMYGFTNAEDVKAYLIQYLHYSADEIIVIGGEE